jgi:glutathione S-transferase
MTIQLHQFPAHLGMPNLSPFCMKVETWLKLAGLPYEIKWQPNPRKGPVGKLPYIVDDGEIVCDSERIIAHLSRKHGIDLDAGLSAPQRALARVIQRMLDEHTYWGVLYSRWLDPAGWAQFRGVVFGALPPPLRRPVSALVQKKLRRYAWSQGLGRHPPDEIYARIGQDLQALSALLGDQPFFMGAQPRTLDASAYAILGNCWEAGIDPVLKPMLGQHPNLVAYCARMRARCFPATSSSGGGSRAQVQSSPTQSP